MKKESLEKYIAQAHKSAKQIRQEVNSPLSVLLSPEKKQQLLEVADLLEGFAFILTEMEGST